MMGDGRHQQSPKGDKEESEAGMGVPSSGYAQNQLCSSSSPYHSPILDPHTGGSAYLVWRINEFCGITMKVEE